MPASPLRLLRLPVAAGLIGLASLFGIYIGTATRSVVEKPAPGDLLPKLSLAVGEAFPRSRWSTAPAGGCRADRRLVPTAR